MKTLDQYVIYVNGVLVALSFADSEENAVTSFREASLGQKIEGNITALRDVDAPFEDYVRVTLRALWARIMMGDMAAMAQRRH